MVSCFVCVLQLNRFEHPWSQQLQHESLPHSKVVEHILRNTGDRVFLFTQPNQQEGSGRRDLLVEKAGEVIGLHFAFFTA